MDRRRKTMSCLCFCKYWYVFYSKIYTKVSPNKLWTITKEDPSERLYIIFSTSFMYEKIKKTCPFCNKSVKHFNMHTLLCCSTFV